MLPGAGTAAARGVLPKTIAAETWGASLAFARRSALAADAEATSTLDLKGFLPRALLEVAGSEAA